MRPLRVVVTARGVMPLNGIGGLERSVHDLVRHLAARGIAVTLIVPPPGAAARESRADPFSSPLLALRHVPYRTFPYANRRGTTVLDRSTAYLVYGWRAGRLARGLALRGDADVIHGFGASALGSAVGKLPRVPLVLNPQGLEEFGATAAAVPMLKRIGYAPLRAAVRRVARAADRLIATDAALEPVVVRHLRPRDGQVVVLPNGIDLVSASEFAGPAEGAVLRRRHGIEAGESVFLSVGRLEWNKGFDVLADALGRAAAHTPALGATGWRWVLVGSGPYRSAIEERIRGAGIGSHVILAGRVSERDLHAWYEAASIFVHPTRYEGSSLVTLEAMAHRRPVIATRAGGLPDKVRPDENGWLVEPGDAESLARAIGEATSGTVQLQAFGARSREIVEREFSWPVLAARHEAMYRELVEAAQSPAR